MSSLDSRIVAYIARASDFAQPLLRQVRTCVHRAYPQGTETIKWGMPHFMHAGGSLCGMAAFKAHRTFGFWHDGMSKLLGRHGVKGDNAISGFGRITTRAGLPNERARIRIIQNAAKLNEWGASGRPRPRANAAARAPAMPADLAAALRKHRGAAATFAAFRPSHRKGYIEWISSAKREETWATRLAMTLEWLAGKVAALQIPGLLSASLASH